MSDPRDRCEPADLPRLPALPEALPVTAACRLLADLGQGLARHGEQVARLSLALFDGLVPLHGLDGEARLELACAGLLHDLGALDGEQGHHKRSRDLIRERFWVLPPGRRERVALTARYHRKTLPHKGHHDFFALDRAGRRQVQVALACLRVADGLDRTHRALAQGLAVSILPKSVEIRVQFALDGREELAAARVKADGLAAWSRRGVALLARLVEPLPATLAPLLPIRR